MAPKKIKSIPALEDFPRPLRMAVARVMAKYNLDYPEALERAALLIDSNSRVFEKEKDREAERRYKSRFMTQLNKARATIVGEYEGRIESSYWNGYEAGQKRGKEEYGVWYNCNICNDPIYLTPNSEPHRRINEFLRSQRWGHSSCHKKRGSSE
jgi:hypothetical protein